MFLLMSVQRMYSFFTICTLRDIKGPIWDVKGMQVEESRRDKMEFLSGKEEGSAKDSCIQEGYGLIYLKSPKNR